MSVEIGTPALSMSESLNSLRETPLSMHRITFEVPNLETWYRIMTEARAQFEKNWRGQPKVKRKFTSWRPRNADTVKVWFEVPDPTFATWCAVKLGVTVTETVNK